MVKPKKRIDAHVHYALPLAAESLVDFLDRTGTDMANLVLVPHTKRLSCVPEALMAKHRYPDRFFVFTSLDASAYFLFPNSVGRHMAAHVKRMLRCGCDGVKIIEGKPNMRKILPIRDFDLDCWEPFWAYAEEAQVPILWHVNDPQEYWDSEKVTDYHKQLGDAYDDTFVNNEDQYGQIIRVLERHPGLKIIFAHFFFLSGQLDRLGKLFDAYPNIRVDMTPGSEMYRILSENHDEAQKFFEKYQDRILYGTDIAARCVMVGKNAVFHEGENLRRSELIDRFFSKEVDEIHEPDGEYLIDVPPFRLRGLDLSQPVIDKIYGENFLAFVGGKPQKVEPKRVVRECRRLERLMFLMAKFSRQMDPDPAVIRRVKAYFQGK